MKRRTLDWRNGEKEEYSPPAHRGRCPSRWCWWTTEGMSHIRLRAEMKSIQKDTRSFQELLRVYFLDSLISILLMDTAKCVVILRRAQHSKECVAGIHWSTYPWCGSVSVFEGWRKKEREREREGGGWISDEWRTESEQVQEYSHRWHPDPTINTRLVTHNTTPGN